MSNLNIARCASGDCCFEQSVERGEVLTTNFRDIGSEQASCERSFRDAEVMRRHHAGRTSCIGTGSHNMRW